MTCKARITSVEKMRHQATETDFLDVGFDIVNESDEVLASRKIALGMDMDADGVRAEVAKYVYAFQKDEDQKVVQAALDAADKNVAELREALVEKVAPSDNQG